MDRYDCIDIHSHILFGVDDGSVSLDESIELLKLAREEGASAVFATPHYGWENEFAPNAKGVSKNFSALRERAAREVPGIDLYLGTEWYAAPQVLSRIRANEAFRMNGTNYVLVEFKEWGKESESADVILARLNELARSEFIPVLAHAERYRNLQSDFDLYRKITDGGTLLQVNAYDLSDLQENQMTRETARWLAQNGMITFIGSDAHRVLPNKDGKIRPPKLREGVEWLYTNCDSAYADAVVRGNALRLLIAANG